MTHSCIQVKSVYKHLIPTMITIFDPALFSVMCFAQFYFPLKTFISFSLDLTAFHCITYTHYALSDRFRSTSNILHLVKECTFVLCNCWLFIFEILDKRMRTSTRFYDKEMSMNLNYVQTFFFVIWWHKGKKTQVEVYFRMGKIV